MAGHAAAATPDPSVHDLLAARRGVLAMHARDGLMLEGVPLAAIAAAVGTPTWVYGAATLRARASALRAALDAALPGIHIHYAVKANDHLAVLQLLGQAGCGADVVSGGELARALRAGIAPGAIVFSGVGKTRAEIATALAAGIAQINVESAEELTRVATAAAAAGIVAPVALRVNPDVDAGTHDKIATGRAGDKFGIPLHQAAQVYAQAAADPWLRPVGLAAHIGSQIADMAPFRAAYRRVAELVATLRATGHAVPGVDCGGGLGIGYRDEPAASIDAYAGVLAEVFGPLGLRLMIEPGRWLAGPAGVLLAGVVLVRDAAPNPIAIVDAAMNELVRPAMYGAWHGILPIDPTRLHRPAVPTDVVGPVCESSDVFARARPLPPLAQDDVIAILDAGAYGAVMSSPYNARPVAAQVMVDGDRWQVIRPRGTVAELWRDEIVPAEAAR